PSARGNTWTFNCDPNFMSVLDPAGKVADVFAHDQADERLILPVYWFNFVEITKYIELFDKEGNSSKFIPDPEGLAAVREYLAEALMIPQAFESLSKAGKTLVIWGAGILIVAAVVLAILYSLSKLELPRSTERSVGLVMGGIIGFGVLIGI